MDVHRTAPQDDHPLAEHVIRRIQRLDQTERLWLLWQLARHQRLRALELMNWLDNNRSELAEMMEGRH
jgi:hypothetical protein